MKVENLCLRLYYGIGGNVTKGIEFSACCLNCLSVVTLGLCSIGLDAPLGYTPPVHDPSGADHLHDQSFILLHILPNVEMTADF